MPLYRSLSRRINQAASVIRCGRCLPLKGLKPLFSPLALNGGELAFGEVCTDSDQLLARQRTESPPLLDTTLLQDSTLPEPVDENLNAFYKRKADKEYAKVLANHREVSAQNQNIITSHEAKVAAHHRNAISQLERFITTTQALSGASGSCSETDLYGALARANMLLSERDASWSQPPAKYLLIASDGLDTRGKPPVELNPDVELLVVGVQPEGSIFHETNHLGFENINAAINYIAAVHGEGQ